MTHDSKTIDQQTSRWKRLNSNQNSNVVLGGKNHGANDELEYECDQILHSIEEIMSQSSPQNVEFSNRFFSNPFHVDENDSFPHAYSCLEFFDADYQEDVLHQIEKIIQEHDYEIKSQPYGGEQCFMKLPKPCCSEELIDDSAFRTDTKRHKWIQSSCFRTWQMQHQSKKSKWNYISSLWFMSVKQNLLRTIVQDWKTCVDSTVLMLEQYNIRKRGNIFRTWVMHSKTEIEQINVLRNKGITARSFKCWREHMNFAMSVDGKIKQMRSCKLIRISFITWKDHLKIKSDLVLFRTRSNADDRVLHRKQKSEALIQSLNKRNKPSSKLNDQKDSSHDKENCNNMTTEKGKRHQTLRQEMNFPQSMVWKHGKYDTEREACQKDNMDTNIKLKKRQHDLENLKKAWILAKLHRSLCLLRTSITAFKQRLEYRKCQQDKAHNFCQDMIVLRCFESFRKNVKLKKMKRLEQYRKKLLMADNHFDLRLRKYVFETWHQVSSNHTINLYPKALGFSDYYRKRRIIEFWLDATLSHQLESHSRIIAAKRSGDFVVQRFSLWKWKNGSDQARNYRIEQEKIKEKWDLVRMWLATADDI